VDNECGDDDEQVISTCAVDEYGAQKDNRVN